MEGNIIPKYHVALSFAGEDREYVRGVAKHLKQKNVEVFFDEFNEIDMWGKDLYTYLADIYSKKAMYTVLFISKNYANKVWTDHERKNAQARALNDNKEYILPAKFDDTEIPGLTNTIAYLDLTKLTAKQLASKIILKLNETIPQLGSNFAAKEIKTIRRLIKRSDIQVLSFNNSNEIIDFDFFGDSIALVQKSRLLIIDRHTSEILYKSEGKSLMLSFVSAKFSHDGRSVAIGHNMSCLSILNMESKELRTVRLQQMQSDGLIKALDESIEEIEEQDANVELEVSDLSWSLDDSRIVFSRHFNLYNEENIGHSSRSSGFEWTGIYDLATSSILYSKESCDPMKSLLINRDSTVVTVVGQVIDQEEPSIFVSDVNAGREISKKLYTDAISDLLYNQSCDEFICGTHYRYEKSDKLMAEMRIKSFSVKTNRVVRQFCLTNSNKREYTENIDLLLLHPTNDYLVSFHPSGILRIWDYFDERLIGEKVIDGVNGRWRSFYAAKFDEDGNFLYVVCTANNGRLFKVSFPDLIAE